MNAVNGEILLKCDPQATHKLSPDGLFRRGLAEASGRRHWPKVGGGRRARGKSFLQLSLNCPTLAAVKQKPPPAFEVLEGRCAGPEVCPLSRVKAGAVVCIKHLTTTPEVTNRLRELGFCEEQRIRLLTRQSNFICQVCNARLAISERLADSIMVQAVPAAMPEG